MKRWTSILLMLGLAAVLRAGEPPSISSGQLSNELMAMRPRLPVMPRFDDTRYVVIEHQWLVKSFLPYFRMFIRQLQMGSPGGEGYDCDNFTYLFRAKLMVSNFLGGGARSGEVPCANLVVAQRQSFGGVPGAPQQRHVLNVIRTDLGWFVIEPQTTVIAPLTEYRNLGNAVEMVF